MTQLPKLMDMGEPLGDRVMILMDTGERKTATGLRIPDSPKGEKPNKGIVFAIGQNASGMTVGDEVMFGKYAGDEVIMKDVDGADHLFKIMKTELVLFRVHPHDRASHD